jgi:nitroreductase
MNPKLQLFFSRRSTRKYQGRPITDETLTDLLEAAMAAPSAVARDPWHFIVITERETLEKMADVLPHGPMLRHAAAGIVVCGDIEQANGSLESYMLQDCSAAIENILLAATALGIGSCWLGIHPRPDRMKGINELFKLPPNIIPVSGIALGWPAEKKEARTRYKDDAVHLEGWPGR